MNTLNPRSGSRKNPFDQNSGDRLASMRSIARSMRLVVCLLLAGSSARRSATTPSLTVSKPGSSRGSRPRARARRRPGRAARSGCADLNTLRLELDEAVAVPLVRRPARSRRAVRGRTGRRRGSAPIPGTARRARRRPGWTVAGRSACRR